MQGVPLALRGTATVGAALFLLLGCFLSPASAGSPISFMNPVLGNILLCSSESLVQQDDFGNFDRAGCEQSCRYRYGFSILPQAEEQGWERRADNYRPGYYLLAHCIDSCNRQFWRNFDRKMENNKKTP